MLNPFIIIFIFLPIILMAQEPVQKKKNTYRDFIRSYFTDNTCAVTIPSGWSFPLHYNMLSLTYILPDSFGLRKL
jgi:hypothetical protein